jgi:hypothetical protein
MRAFREVLQKTSDRLDLPQPVKARILLEIASDLGDVYDECILRGMDPDEAKLRAIEMCDLSDEALEDLVRVHQTPLRRLLGSLSEQAKTRWERAILVTLIVFIAVFSGREVVTPRLFLTASRFIWPVVAVSAYAMVLILINIYRLYIKNDHDPRRIRSGPAGILAAGAVCLLIGLAGLSFEFYSTASSIAADKTGALDRIVEWGLSCSAMLIAALLAAIASGLAWFVLDNRARMIEAAETAWIFDE